ncbi:MAG: GDYXXLXY domain-containing protein [Bacteroidales bacterium]|nr:GDYXXLXY domain-containing protein [Bacteroidales bacterium]
MTKRKLTIAAFILVALAQLYVPAAMIFEREDILSNGKEFRFRAAPVDPYDPFRGKFITLNYRNNSIVVKSENEWTMNENVYAILTEDPDGFAQIKSISREKPAGTQDFVTAKVGNLIYNDTLQVIIEYPFVRFYMEESKAPRAEIEYNNALRDSTRVTWALVSIKNGEAVLKDVLIDGVSVLKLSDGGSAN